MTRLCSLIVFFSVFLLSCEESIDKSLIQDAVKLNSPYSNFILYRYHIESTMAFGSGFTVIKILPKSQECDYTDRDFLEFGNDYPYNIKWKNRDTLLVKCIIDGSKPSAKQPIRKSTLKWKNWTFEIEYYSTFSSGANGSYSVDKYKVGPKSLTFKSEVKSFWFPNNEVIMTLKGDKISLTQVKVDTFQQRSGLSFSDYEFNMPSNYKQSDFYELQPFLQTSP